MQPSTLLQILALTTIYSITIVYGIKCFQCNSYDQPECTSLKNNDTNSKYYQECPVKSNITKMFCRKIHQKLENKEETERIHRSCGWILYKNESGDHCWRADTDFKKERICQCFGDACNSAPKIQNIFWAFLIASVAFLSYV